MRKKTTKKGERQKRRRNKIKKRKEKKEKKKERKKEREKENIPARSPRRSHRRAPSQWDGGMPCRSPPSSSSLSLIFRSVRAGTKRCCEECAAAGAAWRRPARAGPPRAGLQRPSPSGTSLGARSPRDPDQVVLGVTSLSSRPVAALGGFQGDEELELGGKGYNLELQHRCRPNRTLGCPLHALNVVCKIVWNSSTCPEKGAAARRRGGGRLSCV